MATLNSKMKYPGVIYLVLFVLMIFTTPADGFWRLLCHGSLGTARLDPIAAKGLISDHAHAIHGASNFSPSCTSGDIMTSNCTSCAIIQDMSVYWTPALYFHHDNGSFSIVSQEGGMTVYYYNDNGDDGEQLTAFPPGFTMVAGDTRQRNFSGLPIPDPPMSFWTAQDMTQRALAAKSTGFNCLNYTATFETEGSMVYHYLRNKTYLDAYCLDGVRFELMFPSCWNGQDLDSENHKDHILYPDLIKRGECPAGFTTRTPVLFYETIWNTYEFANLSGQFVIANGDIEGYGYHGDFIAGWNQSFLQQAIDTCTSGTGLEEDCPLFELQDDGAATACRMALPEILQHEDVAGPRDTLPGDEPIQLGPAYAQKREGTPMNGIMPSGTSSVPSLAISTSACPTPAPDAPSLTTPSVAATSTDGPASAASTMTSYIAGGNGVVEVIIEEEVFITTTVSDGPNKKRHLHAHQHVNGHI